MIIQYFSRQILFSRTFQESPLNSSTFQACAKPETVCKGYQQTTSFSASKERVKIKIGSTKAISNFRFVFRFYDLNELLAILI